MSLKERKETYIQKISGIPARPGSLCLGILGLGIFFTSVLAFSCDGGVSEKQWGAAATNVFTSGFIITALTAVGLGVYYYIKLKNAYKDFEELKNFIEENMLEIQWNFGEFQKMLGDDDKLKEFLKQLLVLGPSTGNNEEENNSLNEKVQVFKDLFTKDPKELQDVGNYKELVNILYNWCIGRMERFFYGSKEFDDSRECRHGKERYFEAQKDIELASKIVLLKEIVLGEEEGNYPECLSFLTSEDFYENLVDKSKPNFKKLLLHDIRKHVTDVSEEDANDDYIINILTELTKNHQVGTIKTMRDHVTYREHEVLVISAEGKNKARNNQIFKDALETFSNERKEAKKENEVDIYKKNLKF